jgi:hypothetical protein
LGIQILPRRIRDAQMAAAPLAPNEDDDDDDEDDGLFVDLIVCVVVYKCC